MKRYLYGIHDAGGEGLMLEAGRPGWVVVTEEVGADPNDRTGRDYRHLSDKGLGVIVRLNHGYGATGTIPQPSHYQDFATRCAHFVGASRGCTRWIVGNEPNHSQERPGGQVILAEQYAGCFRLVQRAIKGARADAEVICAAVAPWNVESGDWIGYWRSVLANCDPDGLALHAYTHGPDPAFAASDLKMSAPFEHRRWHLRAYRDFLEAVPARLRLRPVYITEANQGDGPWVDANTGWVQAAYGEIDRWNALPGTQKILCLCLYRWPAYDRWGFWNKPGVLADLRAAMQRVYESPMNLSPTADGSGGEKSSQYIPIAAGGGAEIRPPALPPRRWDGRLDGRGARVVEAETAQLPAGSGDVVSIVRAAAQEFGVAPNLLLSQILAESSFDPMTVSGAGAKGLGQIMPNMWEEWAPKVGANDPFDARDSARVAAAYLAWLRRQVESDWQALVAYGYLQQRPQDVPAMWREYANKIMHGKWLLDVVTKE